MRICCCVCLVTAGGEAPRAVTVINGHSVCEEHAEVAQASTHFGEVIAIVRREARLAQRVPS